MAIMEGPLSKWTNVMKGWQYRWFVLDENAGLLSYYTSKEKMMRGARRGCVRLKSAVIGIDDEDDSTFTITVDQKTFHFQARDPEEKEKWIEALEGTILRHSQPSLLWDNKPAPTMHDFDKKLSETDAYLQILIDQVQALELQIQKCDQLDSKEKCNNVKTTAETMIESIKQSIVLLQITKHLIQEKHATYDPQDILKVDIQNVRRTVVNGPVFDNISSDDNVSLDVSSSHSNETGASPSHTLNHSQSTECLHKTGVASEGSQLLSAHDLSGAANCNHVSMPNLSSSDNNVSEAAHHVDSGTNKVGTPSRGHSLTAPGVSRTQGARPSSASLVPDLSYSSSEDEDFFDAEEGTGGSGNKDDEEPKTPPVVVASEGDYFDELYDEEDVEDLGDLNQHGSMITHLLSQVRIGMDLTKVVLPTFILERRSLLEMYADFFAHPDLFVSIADQKGPHERFVQMMRWYLSAFHAGRKYQVAKKPYNPILGETFMCFYDLPNTTPTKELDCEGPVPWSTKSNLSFIAEQVSHHPPISAFYAENYSNRISLDAYIWTKSKFLGLSIGVHMIGQGVISVVDHGEEYIITFPNGYGRSILTVPWMELGGKVNISCPQTGYHATVDFHTKPFYGGKKDLITAELYMPNEKKSFCTVKGEWNGVMWAKYTSGMHECFVDTKNMPIIKKRVLPIDQQGEFESRKLWRDVTFHLKNKNVEEATEGKHKLEQRQREEAKERKELGEKWETKHFHEVGEHWVYDRPIIKRLKIAT